MFRQLFDLCKAFFKALVTEKFKAFRAGFFAGGTISLPFLFHVQGISSDLIWIFPLKLFMSVTFSFCTGLAANSAKDTWTIMKIKYKKRKNKNNETQSKKRSGSRDDFAA